MSQRLLRADKTCENCGAFVQARFCPECGQENVNTRQSAGTLVLHFFEDLTHYEGKFWKSMKYLVFRPGYLSVQYLAGKRNSFFSPVRLYIFLSFITFIVPARKDQALLTDRKDELHGLAENDRAIVFGVDEDRLTLLMEGKYSSPEAIDSANAALPEAERLSQIEIWMDKRINAWFRYPDEVRREKMKGTLNASFPKFLIFFMPVFALVLLLFHRRSNRWYYDHAIFTLHYFSFILLFCLLTWLLGILCAPLPEGVRHVANIVLLLSVALGLPLYYFRSYFAVYRPRLWPGILKAALVLVLQAGLFVSMMLGWLLYVVLTAA